MMMKRQGLALVLHVPLTAAAPHPEATDLVEKHGAAVVNISTTQTSRAGAGAGRIPGVPEDAPLYEFSRRFTPQPGPGTPREFHSQSLGSGFIISADGYVL